MIKPYPNIREKEVLQILQQAEWTPFPRLAPADVGVLSGLVARAWVEQRVGQHGPACYRITALGKQAFKTLMPLK